MNFSRNRLIDRRKEIKGSTAVVLPRSSPDKAPPLRGGVLGRQQLRVTQHRDGRLRALAVTTATRSDALPDIPTVAEFEPNYEASNWFGICAPNAAPPEIVDKLNKEINAALADRKIKARLANLGSVPLALSRLPTSASSSLRKPRSGAR